MNHQMGQSLDGLISIFAPLHVVWELYLRYLELLG
ncbi:hypothetical protein T11_13404 [Trichinella zimbabwensis]|uniref:Uncharacterized protein n=1 Tax=Trichinella zimbabwensis TaxID=268475 RepID=A0A0V1G7M9_9BILA|nr:hypothetical protein T11_13404 [Trichinella zimbabwensis]